ncbi:phosphate ABC transporter substrate-binding protein PstS [Agromyces aerolatus]|uniref:phosphate ABC transporter substrate-binding protein PstS n=1 Tax=Agromyces sp. LY-1074 TaxID=3074080 RepID=UPI002859E26F|nr:MULTISPECIES: phosphate ABC transporter substrate-binding protein PstS [unclassified Agromyces]MDR5701360.1 phosphate ABC transporter substrate-binding protein PstS [Agromyces sp. LY-1074]MDR5706851.1 phosphate ABC transporter substrate-binding protein PstS [Agromyces sp. LY-1358]
MRSRSFASAAALTIAALTLTGCAVNEQGDAASDLAGTLDGAGSSAQGAAQDAWIAGFQRANASVTVNYDPAGSGAGREQFLVGAVGFAGSDAALSLDELDGELARCAPEAGAVDLPVYLSPIVLAFSVDGVDDLVLDASVTARIFSGELTRWNDPAIAALNPGAELPDAAITAVHRSDDSGTTENFTDYLADAAGDDWPWPADDAFPVSGEAAQGNSGIAAVIRDGRNVIGYLDASRAAEFDVAELVVGDEPVAPTAEAAAAAVDASPIEAGRADDDLVVDLARDSTEPGVYPLVLVSYLIACREYADAAEGELVRAYLEWVASEAGQDAAARDAGSAPISTDLRERVQQVVAGIS